MTTRPTRRSIARPKRRAPGQPKAHRGAQKYLQHQEHPEDPSDDDPSSEDDEDDDPSARHGTARHKRDRTQSFSPAIGTDVSSDSKERIKHAYNRTRLSGSASKDVEQLAELSTYNHWKEGIITMLRIEGLMPLLEGTIQKPPRGHKLRFKWEAINIRAGYVLISTVSEPINQNLLRHLQRPRYVWKRLNSLYSVLQIVRDGFEAVMETRISQCSGVADYVHKMERACVDINTDHPWTKEAEIYRCWFLLTGLDTPVWKKWKAKFLNDAEREATKKPFSFQKIAQPLHLAEERKPRAAKFFTTKAGNSPVGSSQNRDACGHCGKEGHTVDQCWKKHPNLAPTRPQGQGRGRDRRRARTNRSRAQTSKTSEATGPAMLHW